MNVWKGGLFRLMICASFVAAIGLATSVPRAQEPADESWRTGPPQPAPPPQIMIVGMPPTPEGRIVPLGAGFPAGAPAPYAPAGAPAPSADKRDLSGVWQNTNFVIPPWTTVEGEPLPYTAEGQSILLHRVDMATTGQSVISSTYVCRPGGLLNDLNFSAPIEIAQSDDTLAIMVEEGRGLHTIRLGGTHPDRIVPTFSGDAIGYWEGDTLVVDVVGFNDETNVDWAGSPHSDQMHVILRMTRVNLGGPYEDLRVLITVDDPVYYSKPWSVLKTFRWRPDLAPSEFDCEGGDIPENRDGMRLENPALITGEREGRR